jgi:hypothetical protein
MRVSKGEIYRQVKRCEGEGTVIKVTGVGYGRVKFEVIEPKNLVDIEKGFTSGQSTRRFKEWFSPVNRKIKRLE